MRRQVILESQRSAQQVAYNQEPLQWLLRGRPRVGGNVLHPATRALFDCVLAWRIVSQYQASALQACLATQLGVETVHHGLNIRRIGASFNLTERCNCFTRETLAHDIMLMKSNDVRMVSWKVVVDIDMRLSTAIRAVGTLTRTTSLYDCLFRILVYSSRWGLLAVASTGDKMCHLVSNPTRLVGF